MIAWLSGQIDERNGYLDEAIARYESVLATRIPERGFDFSQDYEVINALGSALFTLARQTEPGDPRINDLYRKSVTTFQRTLAIDSENVQAHHGIALAYSYFGGLGESASPLPISDKSNLTELIHDQALKATKPKVPAKDRASAARTVAQAVTLLVNGPREKFGSKLNPLHEVVALLGAAFPVEPDADVQVALARALGMTHRALHGYFKPDETAEGRAVGIARRNNPAADQNAQSIVIHSLHRPGAPGLEPTTGTVAAKGDVR